MDGDSYKQQTKHPPHKYFRYGFIDHIIAKSPKPSEDNEKRRKQVSFNERDNNTLQKESKKIDNEDNQKIYASMAIMSGNNESSGRDFGESSQLTNWIIDSGETCHMTPQVSDFILG